MEYHFFKRTSFVFLVIFSCLALIYFIAPAKYSLPFTYYFMCISIIIIGIFKFTMLDVDTQTKSSYYLDLSEAIINSIVGVVAINFGQEYFGLSVILGVIYLIVPSIKLAIAKIKLNQLFIDSFKFLAGFVIIASNANFVWWIKYIIGIVFLGVAISILITKLIHLNQARKGGTFYE